MSEGEHTDRDEPPKSVLRELEDRTGSTSKLTLQDDSDAGGTPDADPQSMDKSLLPKGKGNYRILREIARGGMGTVMKGHDTDLGRDVAVKVLAEKLMEKPEALQRFVEEAQIGGQLQHPGVVPVYELGLMADERPYFTMKLVKGRTLSALLGERKALDDDRHRFVSIFESVCQTVAYAHSKNVIHRDLKPANVMVGAFGEVQVVDWGLAKVLGRESPEEEQRMFESSQTTIETVRSGSNSGSESIAGSVMGTPAYMSPEQANGALELIDERSDVFSLGAVLCEVLTGQPPYLGEHGGEVHQRASRASLEDAHARLEACGADEELRLLCVECLTPARQSRPKDAEEVARRVHEYLASTEQRARDAELRAASARVRARATAVVGAVVVLALVGGGWTYLSVQAGRAQRLEDARVALDDARDDIETLQDYGRHAEAVEAARGALRIAETADVGEALNQRATALFEEAQTRREAFERVRAAERKNKALVDRFDAILARQGMRLEDVSGAYHDAFLSYGLDLAADDLGPALEAMLESGIEEELALALDDWARTRFFYTDDPPELSERLTRVAINLDPHPVRRRVREAILAKDGAALTAVARSESFDELGPGGMWVLGNALRSLGLDEEAWEVVGRALDAHPGSYLLHQLASKHALVFGDPRRAMHHAGVVLSQRPDNVFAYRLVATRAEDWGDWATAARALRRACELAPDDPENLHLLAQALFWLGNGEEAVRVSARAHELDGTDPDKIGLSLLYRYRAGLIEKEPLVEFLKELRPHNSGATLCYALISSPRATRDDLRFAVDHLEAIAPNRTSARFWAWFSAAMGHVRLQQWEDALRTIGRAEEVVHQHEDFRAYIAATRAIARARLGDAADARMWLRRAERHVELLTLARPNDWRPESPVIALLQQARAAVQR